MAGEGRSLRATPPHLLDKAARTAFGQTVKDMVLERRLLEAKRLKADGIVSGAL